VPHRTAANASCRRRRMPLRCSATLGGRPDARRRRDDWDGVARNLTYYPPLRACATPGALRRRISNKIFSRAARRMSVTAALDQLHRNLPVFVLTREQFSPDNRPHSRYEDGTFGFSSIDCCRKSSHKTKNPVHLVSYREQRTNSTPRWGLQEEVRVNENSEVSKGKFHAIAARRQRQSVTHRSSRFAGGGVISTGKCTIRTVLSAIGHAAEDAGAVHHSRWSVSSGAVALPEIQAEDDSTVGVKNQTAGVAAARTAASAPRPYTQGQHGLAIPSKRAVQSPAESINSPSAARYRRPTCPRLRRRSQIHEGAR